MGKLGKPRSSKGLAHFCVKAAEEKQAADAVILDLTKIETSPADYFVVCSAETDVQVRAIADEIERMCKEVGLRRPKTEGLENASWVLQDFFDVVVHIMLKGTRHYYKIEKLWADAKFYQNSEDGKLKAIKELEVFNMLKENELARI